MFLTRSRQRLDWRRHPGSIALYPLPAGIVVAARGCPMQYFLWGDDLVVVDSCSREVVDIVPGVG